MKVPIDEARVIDLDAPTVPAHERIVNGSRRYVFDCPHCRRPHFHGPADGHREAGEHARESRADLVEQLGDQGIDHRTLVPWRMETSDQTRLGMAGMN